jgi:hypothetical protein
LQQRLDSDITRQHTGIMDAIRESNTYRNVKASVVVALATAMAFSAWVLVLSLLRGSFSWPQYEMTTAQIVAGYFGAALVAGPVVGLLWPLTRWMSGAVVVGSVGGTIIYGAIGVAMGHAHEAWFIGAIPGVLIGGGLAAVWWSDAHPDLLRKDRTRPIALLLGVGIVLIGAALVYASRP